MSQKGLESQTNTIIDNFYSYLNGFNHSRSLDFSPIKREIASLKNNDQIKGIAGSSAPISDATFEVPSIVKINNSSVNYFVLNFAWAYRFFHSLSISLPFIVVLGLTLLAIINNGAGKTHIYISTCLILLGIVLGIFYAFHSKVIGNVLPMLIEQLQKGEFKMLSISLYPILFSTLVSIFNYILLSAVILGTVGICLTTWARKLLAYAAKWFINLFRFVKDMIELRTKTN
jgi:hypothetical protein